MCGILGGVARVQISDILVQGLQRLEYRGYDSAGIALIDSNQKLESIKVKGKVSGLKEKLQKNFSISSVGIAHTRWATHGKPSVKNAHPHVINNRIALVHNGIIENNEEIKEEILQQHPETTFASETDTEVAAWHIYYHILSNPEKKINHLIEELAQKLDGSYALSMIDLAFPNQILAIRKGSPLIFGQGASGKFIASDPIAIAGHVDSIAVLEDGDAVIIDGDKHTFFDSRGKEKKLPFEESYSQHRDVDKGVYRHFMQKEIHEQPEKVKETVSYYSDEKEMHFRKELQEKIGQAEHIHGVACGTSYHALCVARYWIEELCGIPCQVDVASEYRYRDTAVPDKTIFLTISQSGETADTLAALEKAKQSNLYVTTLAICNSPQSSVIRMAHHSLITSAGIEVSVASTKAFTTQLALLFLLTLQLSKNKNKIPEKEQRRLLKKIHELPKLMSKLINEEKKLEKFSSMMFNKEHAVFIGRGSMFPLAQEGALKLKEISYMYAEAYPAGELKHGPLALIDEETPVIVVSPPSQLLKKLHSNMEEVQARGAVMLIFLDEKQKIKKRDFDFIIKIPAVDQLLAPILYVIPLQLLAYQVAVQKGTDLDQPRNLAKSVTVE